MLLRPRPASITNLARLARTRPATTMSTTAPTELASGGETDHGLVLEGRRKMIVEDALSVRPLTGCVGW